MSIRCVSGIGILGGLVLLFESLAELKQVRQYSKEARAGQQSSASLSRQFAQVTPKKGGLVSVPSPDVLESLDDLAWMETSRWVLSVVGVTLFAVGSIGMARNWKGSPRVSRSTRPALLLLGAMALAVYLLLDLVRHSDATATRTQIPELISQLPPVPQRMAWDLYSQMWEGVTRIKVPYNPAGGPWIVLEKAMAGFAESNRITIVRFESAGSVAAYVCVCNKDASAMRKFVGSMGQSANKPMQPTPR